ncbi:MAG: FHA domain-containing protein [Anaerolineae bacterium]|nr:FHA domain-containing protein [Anaerolineae bacterium]
MNVCPNCSYNNRVGELVCANCGASIFDDVFRHTREMSLAEIAVQTAPLATRYLVQDATVIIRVSGAQTPISFEPDQPMILGRINNQNPRRPDIDLTAYHAFEKGVSCRHASIQRQEDELIIADMGSTNGTCINGQRLIPHEPYPVRDGDEIRLGNLFMRVYVGSQD